MSVRENFAISKPCHFVICEGVADKEFVAAIIKHLGRESEFLVACIADITGNGGDSQWRQSLNTSLTVGIEHAKSITLVGDTDSDPSAALKKMQNAVTESSAANIGGQVYKLTPPAKCMTNNGTPPLSIVLLPGENRNGELATLVYDVIKADHAELDKCIDAFLKCSDASPKKFSPGQLSKLQTSIAISYLCAKEPATKLHLLWKRSQPIVPITSAAFKDVFDYFSGYPNL